ncbi:hypothetical protein ACC710_36780, partial [Rhizobium ruizarguesonis]
LQPRLALGKVEFVVDRHEIGRLETGGGHNGHNGIKSLDAHCGKEYRRLRLGIGHHCVKEMVQNHVLGDFAKADKDWVEPLLDTLADNADML